MTAPSSSVLHQSWRSGVTSAAFSARKQQALVLLLSQQLMDAQFVRADQAGSERLWQEVALLDIPVDRILHLLYGGHDSSDRTELIEADNAWISRHNTATTGLPGLSALLQRNRHLHRRRFGSTARHALVHHLADHHDRR
jgi:hypothetical protein